MASKKVLEALVSIAGQVDPSLQKSLKNATNQFSGIQKAAKVTGTVILLDNSHVMYTEPLSIHTSTSSSQPS